MSDRLTDESVRVIRVEAANSISHMGSYNDFINQRVVALCDDLQDARAELAELRGVVRDMLEDAAPFPHQLSYQVFDKARKLVTAAEEDADA